MKLAIMFVAGASALLAAAGCGSGSGSSAPSQSGKAGAVVMTTHSAKLGGTLLVNRRGMTLYALSAETGGRFVCTSTADLPGTTTPCVQVWKPLTVTGGQVPTGSVGGLATVRRPDGSGLQVTYKGMPLYTFAEDTRAGEVSGNGFRDVGTWHAVTTGGASSAPASTGGTGGAYGAY